MAKRERPAVLAFRYTFPHSFVRERFSEAWLRQPHDEVKIIQPAVAMALRARGAFAFIVDTGAKAIRGRAFGAMKRAGLDPSWVMKGQTGAAREEGVSDVLFVTRDGIFGAIECKAPPLIDREGRILKSAGQPTEEQLQFLDRVHRNHGIAGVAWGIEDVEVIWPRGTTGAVMAGVTEDGSGEAP